MLVVHPSAAVNPVNNFRIIWCPYVPSLEEDSNTYDDPALTFALINRKTSISIQNIQNSDNKCVLFCS